MEITRQNTSSEDTCTQLDKMPSEKKIKLGICAMSKKINSKHMQSILQGLQIFDEFEVIIFREEIIFNLDIEDWPIVDAMIIFFSNGFPYNKGLKYIQLRNPFLINDFEMQKVFWDRRKVFQILEENKIPTPVNIVVDRGEEINNDGEVNRKQDDTSTEMENMIKTYTELSYKKYTLKPSNKDVTTYTQNESQSNLNINLNQVQASISSPMISVENELNRQAFKRNDFCSTLSLLGNDDNSNQCLNNNLTINAMISMSLLKANNNNVKSRANARSDTNSNNDITDISNEDNLINPLMSVNDQDIFISQKGSMINNDVEKELIEFDDHIEYRGKKLFKPFVEKPCNGDDHNIYIYYPPSHGGGQKRIFRKTKNLCSLYIPNVDVIRKDKSYIYEEFLQTDGFDIKVYTIGPEYAHAEARKAPSLDGKVQRFSEGKEIRYPVNLTPFEKDLSRQIVSLFKQNICGFDILRAKGHSYICDVNGWSFVKGNNKYYEDCALLIRKMILQKLDKKRFLKNPLNLKKVPTYKNLKLPLGKENQKYAEELRSVVAVFRHADRSPKQKMKLVVNNPEILNLFNKFGKCENQKSFYKEIKLKKPKELMEVLNIVTAILQQNNIDENTIFSLTDNFFNKLFQLKMVLEKNLNFEGMTRKIQMRPLKTRMKEIDGKDVQVVEEALMIIKWGGNITHAGIEQAKLLGNTFRVQMYPSYSGDGDGLLRLHSTYRHDLKCYSSDEGRCLKTAASFLQGLLQLEGHLIPIISSMVRKDEPVSQSLDASCDQIVEVKKKVKEELSECLHHSGLLVDKYKDMFKEEMLSPRQEEEIPLISLMSKIENPLEKMQMIYELMDRVIEHFKTFLSKEEVELECGTYFIRSHTAIEKRRLTEAKACSQYPKSTDEGIDTEEKEKEKEISIDDIQKCKTMPMIPLLITGISNDTNFNPENKKPFNSINHSYSNKDLTSLDIEKDKDGGKDIEIPICSPHESPRGGDTQVHNSNSNSNTNLYRVYKREMFESQYLDCEDEKIILICKRWIKLHQDFYNRQTKLFDISKVPDIYDNVKYDLIHNRHLISDDAYQLFGHISLLANFVMPLEYGITIYEKIKIGIKIVGSLLNKIHKDLIWWQLNNPYYSSPMETSELSFSGLDKSKLNSDDIKSIWRHVKTRFYFTCASHLYSLVNTIIFGYDSFLIDQSEANQISLKELKTVFDLDYCSHIVFRLYENFNVELEDPKRFRLEIILSQGSNKDPKEADSNHMIQVCPWIILNNNLTLHQMKEFFCKLLVEIEEAKTECDDGQAEI